MKWCSLLSTLEWTNVACLPHRLRGGIKGGECVGTPRKKMPPPSPPRKRWGKPKRSSDTLRVTNFILCHIIFISILLTLQPAYAAVPYSPYIEDYTWPEVADLLKKGVDTIIIPTGGIEQNGPHISLNKHNLIVRYTSGRIASKAGHALAAPVITYVPEGRINPPEGHMLFPGTVSLTDNTFASLLEDITSSYKQHGFKYICFIGDHGGSQKMQSEVAVRLTKEWQKHGIKVLNLSDYYDNNGSENWVKSAIPEVKNPSAHAGFMDAAEIMAIDKSALRRDKFKAYSEEDFALTGSKGDPGRASVEHGQKLLAFKINAAVAQLEKVRGNKQNP